MNYADLLLDQALDTRAFQEAAGTMLNVLLKRGFPLGSPAKGYDVTDIIGQIADWLIEPDRFTYEATAQQIMEDDAGFAARNEARRMLVGE